MSNKDFYFCYSKELARFIRYDKGIEFILNALHPKTKMPIWLFVRSEQLNEAIMEYQLVKSGQLKTD